MAFRGFFALDGVEIANSSRVVAHLGADTPLVDAFPSGAIIGTDLVIGDDFIIEADAAECGLTEVSSGLFEIPEDSMQVGNFWSPPDGSRRYGPGLIEVDDLCWDTSRLCGCNLNVSYDDSWPGLRSYTQDAVYRPELAPWFSTRIPESGEFGGIWVMDVVGLGPASVSRAVTEMVGSGAAAGVHRDTAKVVTFDALLIACTNAGLEYGLSWLTCLLRDTNSRTDAVLRYFAAHPSHTAASYSELVRESHGVVLTKSPEVKEVAGSGRGQAHNQATMYRVTWEMTLLSPYAYRPPVDLDVTWDTVEIEPIEWVHAADCVKPESCETMPVLFSADCQPETIDVVTSPPPSCGGCLPVCEIDRYVYQVPTMDFAFRCTDTAVNLVVENTGQIPLTLQGYWRVCGTDERCQDNRHPIQVAGLPVGASLTLNSVLGRYWADYDGRRRRPVGIVGTPTGAPWVPTFIDRTTCWEFVVEAAPDASFEISMSLIDREP